MAGIITKEMITAIETAGKLFATLPEAIKEAKNTEMDIHLISIVMSRIGQIKAPDYVLLYTINQQSNKLVRKHTIREAKAILKQLQK